MQRSASQATELRSLAHSLIRARDLAPSASGSIGAPVSGDAEDASCAASVSSAHRWHIDTLGGRVCELHGTRASAALAAVASLIAQVQRSGASAIWVSARDDLPYMADLASAGVDLGSLPVVRVADHARLGRVADRIITSSAFALLILDLDSRVPVDQAFFGRITRTARYHSCAVVLLRTDRSMRSLSGSMSFFRGYAHMTDAGELEVVMHRDRSHGPGWREMIESQRGADGTAGLP